MNGEFRNTVDEKGRLMIPPRVREHLGDSELLLTKSPDNSLWLFTRKDFDELDNAVNGNPLSMFDSNSRFIDRTVIAPARNVELDKTGRLAIPQVLREFAALDGKTECVILCSRNRIEIANAASYDEAVSKAADRLEAAGNALVSMNTGRR